MSKRPELPAHTCRECFGFGQTKETRTEMKRVKGKLVTVKMGSGCPACRGTGRNDGKS